MISEEYDHHWEPLAEFNFDSQEDKCAENYIYCLCSRVFMRDGVKTYYVDKEPATESDGERYEETNAPSGQSHVQFTMNTSYKRDDIASCYCSATHTDNCCSTDEHDTQHHGLPSHTIQPSDSGADLTYQDYHNDYATHEKQPVAKPDNMEYDEKYLTFNSFEKFWAVNGERIIWASWIHKYSDYINPTYLDENNDLIDNTTNQMYGSFEAHDKMLDADDGMRERKFSYDSKVNPYKKNKTVKAEQDDKDNIFLPIGRRRSCSEHDRIISPRTVVGTDSMTNVTKMTLSSYDVTSSHATSDSNPNEDYSVSSSTSDDQSNDQTRIANEDIEKSCSEEVDTDQYWQYLWKKHFSEQYALHYSNYIECLNIASQDPLQKTIIPNEQKTNETILEVDYENSDGNSCELPSVIEVQKRVDKINLEDRQKPRKRNRRTNNKLASSVGMLLQNLLKEEHKKNNVEPTEGGENESQKTDTSPAMNLDTDSTAQTNIVQKYGANSPSMNINGGDEPPEDRRSMNLKSSHEIDEALEESETIKETLDIMGLAVDPDSTALTGQVLYRKKLSRLRPPRPKRLAMSRKTYFDDEGNPYQTAAQSQDEREKQTDEDGSEMSDNDEKQCDKVTKETKSSMSETENKADTVDTVIGTSATKRRRRGKRHRNIAATASTVGEAAGDSELPVELHGHPKLMKYWKKRHSLFHKFDSGVRLDTESWFSVTPERVARHAAARCRADLALDAFCGAGGNTIQLAHTCERVIAIDIDPAKIALARHNAEVYGVADRIEFIVGDFFELAKTLKADVVFLSPPWGGPDYTENAQYDLETMLEPRPASELMEAATNITSNVALYVPRNSKSEQLVSLAKHSGAVEIEQNFLGRRFIALTAYYGDLVNY